MTPLRGARILITGGSGSWGNELTRQLLDGYAPKEVRIYSRGELKQVEMKRAFAGRPELRFVVGDVRDKERLMAATEGIDYIFHLAALKHVPVCEENPYEAVKTNIMGTQNLIDAAIENEVSKFILVSTDKAVDPFNLYGVTKACAEKLVIAANLMSEKTSFACVRAGNVLGTNGSVVPLFKNQLRQQNVVTITDERMTRFFMRVSDAIRLVLSTAEKTIGGELAVLKMPACKIVDLAEVMKEALGYSSAQTKVIGIRPGEKIHEALVSRNERERSVERSDSFIVLPQIDIPHVQQFYADEEVMASEEFTSENAYRLNKEEIYDLLKRDGWLEDESTTAATSPASRAAILDPFSAEGWRPRILLRSNILIAGGRGNLGTTFRRIHPDVVTLGKDQLDITNPESIRAALERYRPSHLINAAALTDIAACELHPQECWKLNYEAVEYLLEICRELGIKLVHVSSDCALDPVNVYGQAKKKAEEMIGTDGVVFRASIYSEGHYVPQTLTSGGIARLYTNIRKNLISMASFVDEIIPFIDADGVVDIGTTPSQTMEEFGRRFATRFGIDSSKIAPTLFDDAGSFYKKSVDVELKPRNVLSPEEDLDRFYHYYRHFVTD